MKKNILIIQPVVPVYRLGFFDKLNENKLVNLKVNASNRDMLGVETCDEAKKRSYVELVGGFISFFNSFFWQKGIKLKNIFWADVVVISGNVRLINHIFILLFCKLIKKKIVWWGQGWTAGSRGTSAKIRRKLMRLSDAIALYSEIEAKEFFDHKFAIGLNNGLNVKEIRSKILSHEHYVNNNSDVMSLCFIGRLTNKCKLEVFLTCLKNVNRKIRLVIIGDGELKIQFEKIVREELNNKDDISIEFLGAMYDESNIGKITQGCDAFIYPGAVGLSLIHAYCHGLPALVHGNSDDHMPEYAAFNLGVNGLNIPRDSEDLSTFIDLIDLAKLRDMKKGALSTVDASFNTDDMAERFMKIINRY
ncbi:glycosyltransferase [Pectobacterium carotovorum]|uniref:glycosyltransferase n=2 Tax=Pectobacterium carotovorum TaxID=554 RepID=UPI002B062319|nr:glycosyltransferase [Pectobacterium carotovorum]